MSPVRQVVSAACALALAVFAPAAFAAPSHFAPVGTSPVPRALAAVATIDAAAMAPTHERSYRARVMVATTARVAPDPTSRSINRLPARSDRIGGPMELLVLEARDGDDGERWLRVLLPNRPNDRSGWIDADHATVSANPWRIVIHTRARTVAVYRSGKRVKHFRSVVGKRTTPTPHGLFAIYERARQPNRNGFLGPWALHLTAHSNVLKNYGGGPGRVAIHGRSGASLLDRLGTARSHGCVRIDNRQVTWLARKLPPGTPVRISR